MDDVGHGLLLKESKVRRSSVLRRMGEQGIERQVLVRGSSCSGRPRGRCEKRRRRRRIPGFYTRTAAGTKLADGKGTEIFDGRGKVSQKRRPTCPS